MTEEMNDRESDLHVISALAPSPNEMTVMIMKMNDSMSNRRKSITNGTTRYQNKETYFRIPYTRTNVLGIYVKKGIKKENKRVSDFGETEVALIDENECVENEMTIKEFLKEKGIVGKYWLVVVDYHN
jgi:hypothetical protein